MGWFSLKGRCGHEIEGKYCSRCGQSHGQDCACGRWYFYVDKDRFCKFCGEARPTSA